MSIQGEATRLEIIEGLQRALDNRWERLRETARAQWEKQFAGADPSDACVTVRISARAEAQLTAVSCGGFLATPDAGEARKMRPRLA